MAKGARDNVGAAGLRLLSVYVDLANRGEHLLERLLRGHLPKQWAHYPENDAIDVDKGYQWFYHSHSPEDRDSADEHGHIHLFARRKLWSRRLRSTGELAFAEAQDGANRSVPTRHLLAIGFDAKGLPVTLFTVNNWVTGDLMLSAAKTADLLDRMTLDTGHPDIDTVIESVCRLYRDEIRSLLSQRDAVMKESAGVNKLTNESREVLSERAIDLDGKLRDLGISN